MCAVESLVLIFLIIINTHARNTLLNIHVGEERSDKFILLSGIELVNSVMFPYHTLAPDCSSFSETKSWPWVSAPGRNQEFGFPMPRLLFTLKPRDCVKNIKWKEVAEFREECVLRITPISFPYLIQTKSRI